MENSEKESYGSAHIGLIYKDFFLQINTSRSEYQLSQLDITDQIGQEKLQMFLQEVLLEEYHRNQLL